MMHRNKKPGDIHKGKWNGLGGKLDSGESPDECVVREIREESGLTLLDAKLRGVLSFPAFKPGEDWLVFVYTATRFEGELGECAEGDLEWVSGERLAALPLWEGDRIFLPWLEQERFFSGKFVYREGRLIAHEVSFS
ncbi:MAG: 8-oxo-dGTP diphosphatase [Elusimicrobia bacterium]|nr:8-oxo-dGTP diphosphatase [Elusimicrobiota bacterium]